MLKRMIKAIAVAIVALVTLEVGLRIVFAFRVGPSVLLRGIKEERVIAEGYTKYKPFQKRHDTNPETGARFAVSINSRGFRGEEFQTEKTAGVTRIVTLGASSTFGFRDRDNETYPFLLGKILAEECTSNSFEVINLGIPHLESKHILALFRKEGLELDPDVVTFYEGINDSASAGVSKVGAVREIKHRARRWPSAVKWYRILRDSTVLVSLTSKLLGATAKESSSTAIGLEQHAGLKSERFLKNVEEIQQECESRGIEFIVANQQATSLSFSREELKDVAYAEEVELLRMKKERESLEDNELYLLIHSELMKDLEEWALDRGVQFVDIIEELNGNRDSLVSWVHLNAEGNEKVARALARPIMERTCSGDTEGSTRGDAKTAGMDEGP